jgi:hypothetical protein
MMIASKSGRALAVVAGLTLALGGCGSLPDMGLNMFSSTSTTASSTTTASVGKTEAQGLPGMVGLQLVWGATPAFKEQLTRELNLSAERRELALIVDQSAGRPERSIKGFLSVDRDSGKPRLVYVWTIFDRDGNKLQQISAEEPLTAARPGADLWSAVPPAVVSSMAERVMAAVKAGPTSPVAQAQ